MRTSRVIVPLVLPLLLVGGGLASEQLAKRTLEDDVRTAVTSLYPEERVSSMNVRGRPYVVSSLNGEVSTAYVELAPGRDARRQLLVQELRPDEGKVGRSRMFVTLPYADGQQGKPQLTRNDAYTDRATVDGRTVTYRASVDGRTLTVRGTGVDRLRTALPEGTSWSMVGTPAATERGVLVEVEADEVRLPRA